MVKPQKKKPHKLFRLSRVRAYLLIKSIKKKLRTEEKKAGLSK